MNYIFIVVVILHLAENPWVAVEFSRVEMSMFPS